MSIVYLGKATPASGQGGGGSITVDQTYDATSTNAQSGTAVAEAIATKQDVLTAGSNISIVNGTISATDTTYSAFGGATSSVAGNAGLVPAPTTGDVDKYLKGDGTWATVSGGGGGSGIQNTATGTDSLTILGTPATDDISVNIGVDSSVTSYGAVAIGYAAEADEWGVAIGGYDDNQLSGTHAYSCCVAIGSNAKAGSIDGEEAIAIRGIAGSGSIALGGGASGINCIAIGEYSDVHQSGNNKANGSIAIGYRADVKGNYSIALGTYATTSSDYEFVIGGDNYTSFKLMNLQTGKIPNDRINVDANPTQNSTNFVTSGTIYDVLGNINTLLSQI